MEIILADGKKLKARHRKLKVLASCKSFSFSFILNIAGGKIIKSNSHKYLIISLNELGEKFMNFAMNIYI